jgi:hypothetical protein
MTLSEGSYPVSIEGRLDEPLSRWLWLVKWLLAIPHYVVLLFLVIGSIFASIAAWFAILFTARYPRALFDYNVGVMRWAWRVAFYSYDALATDKYPPFTLQHDPEYPARLSVVYPEKLSRGLVLVKAWLLALPHYLIVAFFVGGTIEITTGGEGVRYSSPGLIGVLAIIAGIILLFTGKYPETLFNLIMGLNRWLYRVLGYALLMTDDYPPFRLDMGGTEAGPASPPGPIAPELSTG